MRNVSVRKIAVAAIAIAAPVALSFGASTEAWGGHTTAWDKGHHQTHAKATTAWESHHTSLAKTTAWELRAGSANKTTAWE